MWNQQEIEEIGAMWNTSELERHPSATSRWKWRHTLFGGFSYGPIPVSLLVGLFVVLPILIIGSIHWLSELF